jgi:hypothetical protein
VSGTLIGAEDESARPRVRQDDSGQDGVPGEIEDDDALAGRRNGLRMLGPRVREGVLHLLHGVVAVDGSDRGQGPPVEGQQLKRRRSATGERANARDKHENPDNALHPAVIRARRHVRKLSRWA